MTNTLKVLPTPLHVVPMVRSYLTIVKKLQLGDVQLPSTKRGRRSASKQKIARVSASHRGNIPEGGRNNALLSLAGSMLRKGASHSAIEAALQAENLAQCKPPLDPAEVHAISNSIMRYPAGNTPDVLSSLTDTGNAARFRARHVNDVKYVFGLGWVIWDGLAWQRDDTNQIVEMAKQVADDMYQEGDSLDDDAARLSISRHAKSTHQLSKLKAMIELAQSLPDLATHAGSLDVHDMLLGVGNGVVDLKTGTFQSARREDLMTRHSPVNFDARATCPQFIAFIDQVTGGDKALVRYLQQVVGYSLSGSASEQCLFFLYGNGANGKSVFLNVLKELMGAALAKQTATETLMAKRSSPTNDIARLQSVRIAIANEVEDGTHLAESLVKQMTGGEAMTARFHYQEYFEFVPKFKLFIAGNHKPIIQGRDNGIWRRIRLVPFVVTFSPAQQDRNLLQKLRLELPGILNWAIKGCIGWQRTGLATPKSVADAVNDYRVEMDIIGHWLTESGLAGAGFESKAGDAYQSYRNWAEHNGYKPMTAGTFARDLGDRYTKVKRKDANYYLGFKIA